MREYNTLVGDTFRTSISDLREYTKFYCEFYPIYKYLASKTHHELTEHDTSIALLCLIPVQYAGVISARLSHKVPDKHQEDTYTVAQAHEAISYCLADAGPFSGLGGLPLGQAECATASPVLETTHAMPPVAIKTEPTSDQLHSEIFSMVSEGLREVLRGQQPNMGGGAFWMNTRGYGPPPPATQGQ